MPIASPKSAHVLARPRRSRSRDLRSTLAAAARDRAAPAAPRPAPKHPRRCSRGELPGDAAEDAVDEPARVLARVPLRKLDGLVDRDLGRHALRLELLHADPE